MARFINPLDRVSVAAPCPADWDQMMGNERVRFCGQCSLNVYNLSRMTRSEAESLIAGTEGRLCLRFYRRRDGSIITKDCPVGLRAIGRRVSFIAKAVASAVLTFMASAGIHNAVESFSPFPIGRTMGTMSRDQFEGNLVKENAPTVELIQGGLKPGTPLRAHPRRNRQ
jgi:hypothetical protein